MKSFIIFVAAICFVGAREIELKSFSWKNCGPANGIIVESLSLEPDPIVIPGNAVLNVVVDVPVDITSPSEVDVNVQKKIGGEWVEMPCFEHIGSCKFDDLCAVLTKIFGDNTKACPQILTDHGIPCHCPIAAGKYIVKDFTVDVTNVPLPSSLLAGDYHIRYEIKGNDKEGRDAHCLDLYASVQAN